MFHMKQKINVLSLFTLRHSTKLTFLHIMYLQKKKEKEKKKLNCVCITSKVNGNSQTSTFISLDCA